MNYQGQDNANEAPPKYDIAPQPLPIVSQQPAPAMAYNAGYMQAQRDFPINPTQVTVNVVSQQPQEQNPRTWSTSVCGCFEDMESCCCIFWFCPCYTCCSLSPRLGESCCAPICLCWCGHSVPMIYRTKMRAGHGIMGGAIDDCCNVMFCTPCVMCQIKRELDFVERASGKPAFR